MPTDPTPIEDPRNAVGLLTDVLDLVLAQPDYQLFETGAISTDIDMSHPPATRDLGRMFTRALFVPPGCAADSSTSTRIPRCSSSHAHASPEIPPPATIASASSMPLMAGRPSDRHCQMKSDRRNAR